MGGEEFTARDFGYVRWDDYMRAIRVPQLLRFEVAKHRGKVKHAKARLTKAKALLKNEHEVGIARPGTFELIEGWIWEHEEHLAYCERRLKFLNDLANGVVSEEGPEMVLTEQVADPEPVIARTREEGFRLLRERAAKIVIVDPEHDDGEEEPEAEEE